MKRIHKLIATVTAGLLILGLCVYSIVLDSERDGLKRQLEAQYSRSFEELMTDVASLEAKLYKLEVANGTNQRALLLMDVWRQAGETESSIAALPVTYNGSCTLTQFVNRTGDYCRMLSKKTALDEEITEEDYEQIRQLAKACRDVYKALDTTWRTGNYPGDTGFSQGIYMIAAGEGSANLDFVNQEFPRLMYDGPFSESTEGKEPEGLSGKEVTQEKAVEEAAKFLDIEAAALKFGGECNGSIPSYIFTGDRNGMPFTILITKKGGQVLWFMSDHNGGISAVPTDEKYRKLSKAAQAFLQSKGYGKSATSYAQFYDGLAIINLAPVEQNIVLYPDLIKVWVDIPTGDVVGFDANNYLMSHKKRSFDTAVLTEEQAKEKLNGGFKVQGVRLALIPLESGTERLCWEFTGTLNGNEYIVYINVKTGVEEDILMIQHINDGTLVL